MTRHPQKVAAKQLPVTVGEPLQNQRHTATNREKWAFTGSCGVNARGMSEFGAKRPVCGFCGSNQGCCGVNVMKIKDRCWNGHRGRAYARVASAAAVFQLREKCIFLVFHTTRPTAAIRAASEPAAAQFRSDGEACSAGAVAGIGGASGDVLEARHHPLR